MKNFTFFKLFCSAIILALLCGNVYTQPYPAHKYPYAHILKNEFLVRASGMDTFKVVVSSDTTWSTSMDAGWLTRDKGLGSYDDTITVIVIEANPDYTARTAIISVAATNWWPETATFYQATYNPVLFAPADTIKLGDTTNLADTFQINSNTVWIVTSSAMWLNVTPKIGTNNMPVIITAERDTTFEKDTTLNERIAYITITADSVDTITIPVKQIKGYSSLALWNKTFQVVPNSHESPRQYLTHKQNSLILFCFRKIFIDYLTKPSIMEYLDRFKY